MPMYPFEAVEDGVDGAVEPKAAQTRIELAFPMAEAPRIGEVITHDGKLWRRVPSSLQVDDGAHRTYPYVSSALPRGLKGCEHTDIGKPVIRSRRHESEVASRLGLVRD